MVHIEDKAIYVLLNLVLVTHDQQEEELVCIFFCPLSIINIK